MANLKEPEKADSSEGAAPFMPFSGSEVAARLLLDSVAQGQSHQRSEIDIGSPALRKTRLQPRVVTGGEYSHVRYGVHICGTAPPVDKAMVGILEASPPIEMPTRHAIPTTQKQRGHPSIRKGLVETEVWVIPEIEPTVGGIS